ncbi:hypothetical protein ACQPWY_27540 [Pseudonocardia xinjiangensis]|uniref:hypothetical protein n=1 Tax=Pseudonocardia xinjiangensis TaxID=75289 RepID=UPI003D9019D3
MIQAEPYLVRRTDTALLAVPDRTDLWVEHVCRNHGTLDFRFDDGVCRPARPPNSWTGYYRSSSSMTTRRSNQSAAR